MLTLKEKIRGCIAGSWIGSAMGAVTEGWLPARIQETYGVLDDLKTYRHGSGGHYWQRPPGTTEDGIERQKLMNTAVIRKQDRITADDLVAVWLEVLDPEKMVYKQEAFDVSLLQMARSGVPPRELGRLWPFNNVVSMARSSHTLGIINAGDPLSAALDVYDVGLVYNNETTFAMRWAALYDAALARALQPGTTVDDVLETVREFARFRGQEGTPYAAYDRVAMEIDRALEVASRYERPLDMRDEFYTLYYGGSHFTYSSAQANEVVAKGLAIFACAKGDPLQSLIAAVNFGRDTDCLAAVAVGLAGALSGVSTLKEEWIAQVNAATKEDPYTNSPLDIDETTEGLYAAVQARLARQRAYLAMMDGAAGYLA